MYSSSAKNNYEKTERFSRTSLKRFEITLEKVTRPYKRLRYDQNYILLIVSHLTRLTLKLVFCTIFI